MLLFKDQKMMKHKVEHNFPTKGNRPPKFYILTPDEVQYGKYGCIFL